MIEISTDRLVLKKTSKSDKDKELLVSRIGDWEVAKWLCNVPHPYTEDDAEAWFKKLHQKEFSLNGNLSDIFQRITDIGFELTNSFLSKN